MRRFNKKMKRFVDRPKVEIFINVEIYGGDKVVGDKVGGSKFRTGDIGEGARVAVGANISWREGVSSLSEGEGLERQFASLLQKISEDASFDEDTRELARSKTEAIASGIVVATESPGVLRRALLDAKSWFSGATSWVGHALGEILKGEPAQKTLGTVTEAATKAVIAAFTDRV